MIRFCAIYTERLFGHTMKFLSFLISDAWLIAEVECPSYLTLYTSRRCLTKWTTISGFARS